MSRAVSLAFTQFEMPRLVMPSFVGLRASFQRVTTLSADAAAIFAANEAIRRSSRGWMI
jgi:hypothetical protein